MGTFLDLFVKYACKNLSLRVLVRQAYKYGMNVSQEPSAARASGLDAHALARQVGYVAAMKLAADNLKSQPLPDWVVVHPTSFDIDLRTKYVQFVEESDGTQIALNEHTQQLCEMWMTLAVELACSQSSGQAGSLIKFDHARTMGTLAVIEKVLAELALGEGVDLPETALPGAGLGVAGDETT